MARKSAMKWNASRGQYCNQLSCKGNLVVKCSIGCICCFLFIPLIPSFSDDSFCARRDVDCCALYHGISSSYSTQVFITFFVYKIGPLANPINDRLMFRLMIINVKKITDSIDGCPLRGCPGSGVLHTR